MRKMMTRCNCMTSLLMCSTIQFLHDSISLRQVLALLEEKDQMLIRLRYFKGKTQVETAAVLGMTQVQVSRREKKILLHLRELLL